MSDNNTKTMMKMGTAIMDCLNLSTADADALFSGVSQHILNRALADCLVTYGTSVEMLWLRCMELAALEADIDEDSLLLSFNYMCSDVYVEHSEVLKEGFEERSAKFTQLSGFELIDNKEDADVEE